MANRESHPTSSLGRLFSEGFWFSAGLMAVSDWITGRNRTQTNQLSNDDVRFEHSDISIRGVILTGLGVFLFFHISTGIVYFVFEHFKHVHAEQTLPPLPIAAHGPPQPAEPRLQQSPRRDLRDFEATEMAELNAYKWINKQKGTVAIPIDRAMDLILQRGIPPEKGLT